ncbi:MAG: type II toxin-antitoxin system RelB/DinJ family antitoxin [Lactobacillaceae bacterium]|jgi:addiction module RelB/DinJ family antitoxin|nr:type II toxin-antitoxin system RelB/DinJ family antitoxin [Lactobacillaceae bacterium]
MNSKKKIQVNIDGTLNAEVTTILDDLGLNMTTAIVAYLKRIVATGSIPFDLALTPRELAEKRLMMVLEDEPMSANVISTNKELMEWLDED